MQGYGTFSSIHFRFGAAEHLKIFCQGAVALDPVSWAHDLEYQEFGHIMLIHQTQIQNKSKERIW